MSEVVRTYARMGAQMGTAAAVMSEAARAFNESFAAAAQATAQQMELARARRAGQLTPEQRDEISRRRYEQAVRHHRQAAGVHLQRETKRVRRELGLS